MITPVFKKVLKNGLTLLVMPRSDIPKVSLQLWYNVGSKHEGTGTRGLAHLIEHMIFKGTDKLSESDINVITHKLSGVCNAFTSNDYTGYLFDIPSQHWQEVLPIMADCMSNCSFKQHFLNSELKAVIQELKMYNDDYLSTLIEKMVSSLFPDHPYHYPIVGFKQDLWSVSRRQLLAFYHQFYGPNNATMVVVGDVDIDEVVRAVEKEFGAIKPLKNLKRPVLHHSFEIGSKRTTIYRDIKQPMMLMAWIVPGVSERKEYLLDLMSWVLGAGRGARLYSKLVTEMGLATEVQSFVYDLFDYGIFFVYVQPTDLKDATRIEKIILEEIEHYRTHEISNEELERARRKTSMDILSLGENNQRLAYVLGKFYLATGDEKFLEQYANYPTDSIKKDIKDIFARCFVPSLTHYGRVEGLSEEDRALWLLQQEQSDKEDTKILAKKTRKLEVEPPSYALSIKIAPPKEFSYPRAKKFTLSNGLKVFVNDRPGSGKIDLLLDLKAKHFYDSPKQQGLSLLMTDLLQEGTKNYSAQEFAQELESLGMELNTFPGQMGMTFLAEDANRGLELFTEVLERPAFTEDALERIREQLLAELKVFWDSPTDFVSQVAREAIYRAHPFSNNMMGTETSVKKITRHDVVAAHKKYIVPHGGRLALVGDLSRYDVKALLEKHLASWNKHTVADMDFPVLEPAESEIIQCPINRDQIVLAYAGLSVDRLNKDFDALLLFDQIFTGGVLGSMSSRLFDLRERSGLFYTIGGSLLAGAALQPGMIFIKSIVSGDRLEEAEREIEKVITTGALDITKDELEDAQNALINSLVDNFAAQRQMAATFVAMDIYGMPDNYFDKRPHQLLKITKEQVQKVVHRILKVENLVKIRAGRV
ncbi:TPA: hypothetical protein DDZ86_00750 [Candidatus Dependentiae bacterium]|nr:MAG: hypothetical protein UW09_C0004G0033 [candidate division TM6 bacterium GW2011_GWF2_43_87]HBL98153.1 hypothetical protein [Candidatus Dependentiae bacterium]